MLPSRRPVLQRLTDHRGLLCVACTAQFILADGRPVCRFFNSSRLGEPLESSGIVLKVGEGRRVTSLRHISQEMLRRFRRLHRSSSAGSRAFSNETAVFFPPMERPAQPEPSLRLLTVTRSCLVWHPLMILARFPSQEAARPRRLAATRSHRSPPVVEHRRLRRATASRTCQVRMLRWEAGASPTCLARLPVCAVS